MFSDQPVTPRRVEIVLDVITAYGRSAPLRKEQLLELVQPETLPGFNTKAESTRSQGESALRAARELELIEEQEGGWVPRDTYRESRKDDTRTVVRRALDARVLADTEVEPYFAHVRDRLAAVLIGRLVARREGAQRERDEHEAGHVHSFGLDSSSWRARSRSWPVSISRH